MAAIYYIDNRGHTRSNQTNQHDHASSRRTGFVFGERSNNHNHPRTYAQLSKCVNRGSCTFSKIRKGPPPLLSIPRSLNGTDKKKFPDMRLKSTSETAGSVRILSAIMQVANWVPTEMNKGVEIYFPEKDSHRGKLFSVGAMPKTN